MSTKTLATALANGCVFLIGITVLVLGTYSSVHDIVSIEPLGLECWSDCSVDYSYVDFTDQKIPRGRGKWHLSVQYSILNFSIALRS